MSAVFGSYDGQLENTSSMSDVADVFRTHCNIWQALNQNNSSAFALPDHDIKYRRVIKNQVRIVDCSMQEGWMKLLLAGNIWQWYSSRQWLIVTSASADVIEWFTYNPHTYARTHAWTHAHTLKRTLTHACMPAHTYARSHVDSIQLFALMKFVFEIMKYIAETIQCMTCGTLQN